MCVLANTGWYAKYVLLGVRPPYFAAELVFSTGSINGRNTILGGWVSRKLITADFHLSGTTPNFGIVFQDGEN